MRRLVSLPTAAIALAASSKSAVRALIRRLCAVTPGSTLAMPHGFSFAFTLAFGSRGATNPTKGNHMTDEAQDDGATPRGQFQPGQSGNPKGRPKMPKTVKEVRELCKTKTVAMVEVLSKVALNPKSPPAARAAAASAILDRAWGRPSADFGEGAEGLVIRVVKFNDLQIDEPEMKTIEHDAGQADG